MIAVPTDVSRRSVFAFGFIMPSGACVSIGQPP